MFYRVLLVLALTCFIAANITLNLPSVKRLSGGLPILDMRIWYSDADAYRLFDALGRSGRDLYIALLWTFDLCMPILFGAFLSGTIRRTRLRRMSWLPFVATAFDYAENVAISALLLRYPTRLSTLVLLASTFTLLKWVFYCGSVLAIVGVWIHAISRRTSR